jgi:Ca2+-binding EF-hand superfamily protein
MRYAIHAALITGLALLACGSHASAADGNSGKKGKDKGATIAQQMIEKFDKDGDGKLDATELAAALEEHQAKHAKTEKVVKQGKAAKGLGATSDTARAEELIKRFDTNGDHKLDAAELQTMLSTLQTAHAAHKKAAAATSS